MEALNAYCATRLVLEVVRVQIQLIVQNVLKFDWSVVNALVFAHHLLLLTLPQVFVMFATLRVYQVASAPALSIVLVPVKITPSDFPIHQQARAFPLAHSIITQRSSMATLRHDIRNIKQIG